VYTQAIYLGEYCPQVNCSVILVSRSKLLTLASNLQSFLLRLTYAVEFYTYDVKQTLLKCKCFKVNEMR